MNSNEIVLFTIIVFLFIIGIFMFVLLRKSFEKKKLQEQKKFEYKNIVNITPEFKFDDPKTPDIPSVDEILKPIKDNAATKENKEKIPSEVRNLKTHEELEEILIAEPKIIESIADDNEPQVEDYSGLKLEDTLIDIEDEKKERKKAAAKKPETKVTEKDYPKKRKSVRKKKEAKEESIKESVEVETKKES